MLVLLFVLMGAMVAVTIAMPMLFANGARSCRAEQEIYLLKAQLAELEQAQRQGDLSQAEFQQTQQRLGSKLLKADAALQAEPTSKTPPLWLNFSVLMLILGLGGGSATLLYYGNKVLPQHSFISDMPLMQIFGEGQGLGRPNLPMMPYAARDPLELAATQAGRLSQERAESRAIAQGLLPEVSENPVITRFIQELEAKLRVKPQDIESRLDLANALMQIGQYRSAALHIGEIQAQIGAVQAQPPSWFLAQLHILHAEALFSAAAGVISLETETQIDQALMLEPQNRQALFYKALALGEAKQYDDAIERLQSLLGSSDLTLDLQNRIRDLIVHYAQESGLDPIALLPDLPQMPVLANGSGGASGSAPLLNSEQIAQMQALSLEEQQEAIQSMVDGLEARLRSQGGNAQAWLRLVRARLQLDGEETGQALAKIAYEALREQPEEQRRFEQSLHHFGQQIGVTFEEFE